MYKGYEHPIVVPLMLLAGGAAFCVYGVSEVVSGAWLSLITLIGGLVMIGFAGVNLARRWRRSRA
ncbi:MAG: hypothetical protein ACFE0P_01685 [Oceanicaulis sp.]